MSKTILEAAHPGKHVNGVGGCHTRWAHDGECCGVGYAEWLNSLGDDNEVYGVFAGKTITNGDVRNNWLSGTEHLKFASVAAA